MARPQGGWPVAHRARPVGLEAMDFHGNLQGHSQLAIALLSQKRYNEGIEVLEAALQLKSTWRELHYNLGYACAQLGRTNEAVLHLRNALERDPNYVPTYSALAELLIRRGDKEEARRKERAVQAAKG